MLDPFYLLKQSICISISANGIARLYFTSTLSAVQRPYERAQREVIHGDNALLHTNNRVTNYSG